MGARCGGLFACRSMRAHVCNRAVLGGCVVSRVESAGWIEHAVSCESRREELWKTETERETESIRTCALGELKKGERGHGSALRRREG